MWKITTTTKKSNWNLNIRLLFNNRPKRKMFICPLLYWSKCVCQSAYMSKFGDYFFPHTFHIWCEQAKLMSSGPAFTFKLTSVPASWFLCLLDQLESLRHKSWYRLMNDPMMSQWLFIKLLEQLTQIWCFIEFVRIQDGEDWTVILLKLTLRM